MSLKTGKILLALSVALFIVATVGAHLVQSDGGKVEISDMRWKTPAGYVLSALIFKPDNATPENPAPAIVTAHGILNCREMQNPNYVELARRGYVVVAIDMYAHGFSQIVTGKQRDGTRGTGLYDAAELTATLPFVDRDKIGLTGHSYGARSANWSMPFDDEKDKPIASAVFLQCADAIYANDKGEYYNYYGARHVGILAAEYDEFFHRMKLPDGTTSLCRDYLQYGNAQSFLHFGADPKDFPEKRKGDTVYKQDVGGREVMRVIYSVPLTHPRLPYAGVGVARVLEFFDLAFGMPKRIDPNSQVWQTKEALTGLGLVAFVLFVLGLTRVLLETRTFSPLRAESVPELRPLASPAARNWVWGGLFACAIFSAVTYIVMFEPVNQLQPGFRTQYPPLFIGLWAAVCGLSIIAVLFAYYKKHGQSDGFDLAARGVTIKGKIWLTVLLGVTVVVAAYIVIFAAHYLFLVDFRFWLMAIKPFNADKIPFALKMAPLFLVYYLANSVAVNCFNRFKFPGGEWGNVFVLAVFNALSSWVLLAWQYGTFFSTGEMLSFIQALQGIHLYTISLVLFVSAFVCRSIYRMTLNPYLGGLINGLAITAITIANTQTLYY